MQYDVQFTMFCLIAGLTALCAIATVVTQNIVRSATWLLFTLAGTLYGAAASTTPIAGATIRVTDANGVTQKLVTAANGNFWATGAVAYPVQVAASRCPSTTPMVSAVNASGASCNGCHNSGSRIHLP